MRVHIGGDHAGHYVKGYLIRAMPDVDFVDHGPADYDAEDDYPPYCFAVAEAVVGDPGSLGIVLGGSGNGEQMAANKVAGVRAALAYDEETAVLARRHNDANVLALGATLQSPNACLTIARTFVSTAYEGEERHGRRIRQLDAYLRRGDAS